MYRTRKGEQVAKKPRQNEVNKKQTYKIRAINVIKFQSIVPNVSLNVYKFYMVKRKRKPFLVYTLEAHQRNLGKYILERIGS